MRHNGSARQRASFAGWERAGGTTRLNPVTPPQARRRADDERMPLQLRDYLSILARRRLVITAAVLAAVFAAVAATMLPAARWTGSSTVRVEPGAALSGGTVRSDDIAYLDRLINTYGAIIATPQFAADVARKANIAEEPTISHDSVANTNLMVLHATTDSRADSMRAANAAASQLVSEVQREAQTDVRTIETAFERRSNALEDEIAAAGKELEALRGTPGADARQRALKLDEQIRGQRLSLEALRDDYETQRTTREARAQSVSVVAKSALPAGPDNRNVRFAVAIAAVLGLLAGVLIALLRENLAQRFRTRDEVEALTGVPVLSAIPKLPRLWRGSEFGTPEVQEAFRRLRTALLLGSRAQDSRLLMISSAERGEGKSTVAANLARNIALTGRTVLLVDADLRLPSLHTFFDLPSEPGVSEILTGSTNGRPVPADNLIRPTGQPGLFLLPAGRSVDDTATLLASKEFGPMLRRVAEGFDIVIVDSPAVLAVTDALIVSPHVDDVLLITGSDLHRDNLRQALTELQRAGVTPMGVVITRSRDEIIDGNIGYYQPPLRATAMEEHDSAASDS
jgi:capsular exopolysaccharide synthesis family protein